jgi:hypothetical protein
MNMLIVLVVGLFLLAGGPCSQNKAMQGHSRLRSVRFPNAWTKSGPDGRKVVLTQPHQLELRENPNVTGGELLFAVRLPDGSYSDDYYSVGLNGDFPVHAVTREVWNRAKVIPSGAVRQEQEGEAFAMKRFVKSGDSWGSPPLVLSRNKRWCALFSYSSKEQPLRDASKDSNLYLGGGEPSKGNVFVDFFEASSGEMILSGEAPYSGFGPSILFSQAVWAEDRYFVMPLDILSQTCFLAILQDN